MKNENLVCIELTDSYVKCLQAKRSRSGPIMMSCDVREIPGASDEDLKKALSDILFLKNIRADNLSIVIPRRLAILKQLHLPSHDEEEIKKMVELQVASKIPYAPDDIVLDYMVIDKDSSGYAQVLVMVVHKEVVERYLKIINTIGITPHRLLISSLGILGWSVHQRQRSPAEYKDTIAIFNIDPSSSEICFCRQDSLLFSRHINYGTKDLKDNGELTAFLQQIDLTFDNYRKQGMGPDFKRILIISTAPEAARLKDKLYEEFKIETNIVTSLDHMPCDKNFKLAPPWGERGLSLAATLGVLLFNPKRAVNLLPEEVHTIRQGRLKRRELISFFSMAVVTAGLGLAALGVDIYKESAYLRQVQTKLEEHKAEVEKVERKSRALEFVKKEFGKRVLAVDIIRELYNFLPTEISLRSLYFDAQGAFIVEGFAKTPASVNAFQSRLVSSQFLKEVTLQYATQRQRFNQEVTDFKITSQLVK